MSKTKLKLPGLMIDPRSGREQRADELPPACLLGPREAAQARVLGRAFTFREPTP
jgi:hypothetical protein